MKELMYGVFCLCIINICAFGQAKENSKEVTLLYNVAIREFTHWREGELTGEAKAHPGDESFGWHLVNGNLYFVRGQTISVLLVNAVAQDLFSLEIKVDDLIEPTVPISGSLSDLPKLLPIPPAPAIVAGVGAKFASGSLTDPSDIYRLLTTAEEKDFKSWIQTKLIDPLEAKEVKDFLAIKLEDALSQLNNIAALRQEVQDTMALVGGIPEPTTLIQLIDSANWLARLVSREFAFRNRLLATNVPSNGKIVGDAITSIRSSAIQQALDINPSNLSILKGDFLQAFPSGERFARIEAMTVGHKSHEYEIAGLAANDFLNKVNAAVGNRTSEAGLTRLKSNLQALADSWPDIETGVLRRTNLEKRKAMLEDPAGAAAALIELQKELSGLADLTIQNAAMLNEVAQSMPLEGENQVLPVGQWFSSKQVAITLKQGQRLRLFDIGGVSDTARTTVIGGDQPATKSAQTAAADLAPVRTFQFRVYNLHRFKLGLGFVYSTTKDERFQVVQQTIGSGSTATTQAFFDQTRSRDYNLLATVDLITFPWARHSFPSRPRFVGEKQPRFYQDIGPMIGFSVTSPNRDFLLGGAWFPRLSPVGIKMGWHIGLRDYPPRNAPLNEPITNRTVVLQQTRKDGFFIGLTFTTDFFGKVFTPIFKQ